MSARSETSAPDSTVDAITRVLDAEKSARLEIADHRRQALDTLREARAQARTIAGLADARIGRMQIRTDAAIRRQLEAMESEAKQYAGTPRMTSELGHILDMAMDRLIDELIA